MKQILKKISIAILLVVLLTGCSLLKSETVKNVESLISKVGEVTLESETAIIEAEKKYNELIQEEKEKVENYNDLKTARETYNKLVDDNSVSETIKSIDDIGEVTLEKKDLIKTARDKYDELKEDLKTRVTNYSKLEDAEKKLKDLKKSLADSKLKSLNKTYDKMQGITWYEPKAMPYYIDSRCYLLPYIGVSDKGNSWIVIRYNYTGDDWVFWKNLTILVDGKKYYKSVNYFSIDRDNDSGVVWETYDDTNVTSTYVEMLRAIAKSKDTTIRFEGDQYYWDYTIPSKDKTAISQVLEAYDALN